MTNIWVKVMIFFYIKNAFFLLIFKLLLGYLEKNNWVQK
jgi:hypothetical protein